MADIVITDEKTKNKNKKEPEFSPAQLDYLERVKEVEAILQRERQLQGAEHREYNKESFILHLSSEHADEYIKDANGDNLTSGYKINLEDTMIRQAGGGLNGSRMEVALTEAQIPNTWYNIDDRNNFFNFRDNETDDITFTNNDNVPIFIPPGHYTHDTLASQLQIILNINTQVTGATYEVFYDDATHKFSFIGLSANLPFYLVFDIDTFTIENTASHILGFGRGIATSNNNGGAQSYLLSSSSTRLISVENIYVTTSLSTRNVYHPRTSSVSNVLAKIPVKVDKREILHYEKTNEHFNRVDEFQISFLILKLVDENGNLLDLNSHNWNCTIKINIYPNVD